MVYGASGKEQPHAHEDNITGTELYRECVGLFLSAEDLQNAIRELEGTAFPRQDISVMASQSELMNAFGVKTIDPHIVMDTSEAPRQAPARPEEKTIGAAAMVGVPAYVGAMAAALTMGAVAFPAVVGAAVIGGLGGGTLGAILTKLLGDRNARHYEEQIEKGGLLLWVRTPDRTREEIAVEIMRKNHANEVHVHDVT